MKISLESITRIRFSDNDSSITGAKNIGVALGPGWPMGLVGLGLLMALKQLKISVGLISGTSMGAIIAALYASGVPLEEISGAARNLFAKNQVRKYLKENTGSLIKVIII